MDLLNRSLNSKHFWPIFFTLAIFIYFFGLTIPLLGPDEPRYTQVAREMFERGDWVTPTLGGFNWFEKPALLYWLQHAAFNVFGVSEFAARLGSAFFGLGTVASLFLLGRTAEAEKDDFETNGAWIAMVGASTLGLIVFSRGASFDIILTFPITAALTGFYLYDRSDRSSRVRFAGLAAFYVFTGLAILAKGLVGLVFPFAIVAFYHLISLKMPSKEVLISLIWGTLLAVAVASSWYLPMYLRHGYGFIDEFFIQHHFQRYTSNKYQHPQPFHFFLWVLPLMTIPWMPFFIVEVWRNIRDRFSRERTRSCSASASLVRFAFAWIIVPLVFFSFSGSKLPGYILPAVPPAVVLAAIAAARFANRSLFRAACVKLLAVTTLVTIIIILQFVLPGFADNDSVKRLITSADDRGYGMNKVVGFVTISHNAEFYAAGRLLRGSDGKQRRLNGPSEVTELLMSEGKPVLLLIRPEHLKHVVDDPEFAVEMIADNGELAIVAATLRQDATPKL